jgi:hypothetical protein
MYLRATQAAAEHRIAAGLAAAAGHTATADRYATAAEQYEAKAAEARSLGHQLYAARKLGLRGSAGAVPPGYFDSCVPERSEERSEGGQRPTLPL